MIALTLAAVFLTTLSGIFLTAYFKSKGLFKTYLESVDKKEYVFKDFMPIGLFLNEKVRLQKILPAKVYKYLYRYENNIKGNIIELYGMKYADYHLMIHKGNRTALGVSSATAAALLSVVLGIQGDQANCGIFLLAGAAALIGVPLLLDKSLKSKIEKRRLSLQMEFPDFINKLTLLVNAGMTISKAWEKIVADNEKNTPLYNEMTCTLGEIRAGKPEIIAYEEFGRRCKVKEVIKFVSVIVMNLKKGGAEVVPVLKMQAMECWEIRKNVAKRLGEEAATKILIPLMIMFLGIIIIVATPAILSFSSGM